MLIGVLERFAGDLAHRCFGIGQSTAAHNDVVEELRGAGVIAYEQRLRTSRIRIASMGSLFRFLVLQAHDQAEISRDFDGCVWRDHGR